MDEGPKVHFEIPPISFLLGRFACAFGFIQAPAFVEFRIVRLRRVIMGLMLVFECSKSPEQFLGGSIETQTMIYGNGFLPSSIGIFEK